MYTTTPMPTHHHHHLSDSDRRSIFASSHASSLRLYQLWKGSNRFFLGGRLVFGPDATSLFLTILLIATPVILFCSFVSQDLVNHFPLRIANLIVSLSAVFTLFIIILLFLTSGRDPGIIPRNSHPPEAEAEAEAEDDQGDADADASSIISTDWAASSSTQGVPQTCLPPTKDVTVNGMVVKVKYCQTCMLYRPPRCSHCSICNNCVERFDHHCPWVGQCIGKRNYRFFFMFVSSTTMLCLYVFAFCWVNINNIMEAWQCNLWKALMKSPVSGILILYTFVAAWFVGGLTVFHLYLIFTNQTTYENFRYRYDRKTNPYNLGCPRNIGEIFFSKIPNSKNKFRAKVKGDSSSVVYTTTSMSLCRGLSPEMPNTTSFDIEMGKRKAVGAEDFEDIQSQIESVGGLDTQARHTNWDDDQGNWETTTHDIHMLGAEFGMGDGVTTTTTTDREKITGSH